MDLSGLPIQAGQKRVRPSTNEWKSWVLSRRSLKFGHCNVPREYVDDLSLASWCQIMRMSYWKMKEIDKIHRRNLPQRTCSNWKIVDFSGELLKGGQSLVKEGHAEVTISHLRNEFGHLTTFKEKHGHLRVTDKHDRSLASLCTRMRFARRNPNTTVGMTEERIKVLNDIGFEWKPHKKTSILCNLSQHCN